MALITSSIISTASGSVGSLVLSNNHGNLNIRKKSSFGKFGTPSQDNQRQITSTVAKAWRQLTDKQRQGWITLASQYYYHNKLGKANVYSGFIMFNKCNSNCLRFGLSIISQAYSINSYKQFIDGEFTIYNGFMGSNWLLSIEIPYTGVSGAWVEIWCNGLQSSGITYLGNFKIIKIFELESLSPMFLQNNFVNYFGRGLNHNESTCLIIKVFQTNTGMKVFEKVIKSSCV